MMTRFNLILLFIISIPALGLAQKLVIDTVCYNQKKFNCGLVYQVKYDSGQTDTMFVRGGSYSVDVKYQFLGEDTLAILRGSLGVGRSELSCYWYIRDESGPFSEYGWKWQEWNYETLYHFKASSTLPFDDQGNYISQEQGRVPINLDNLVFAGFGNIYEIVDGEKLSYGNKYFEEINNGAQAVYQQEASSLLAKHIGKENLDPKVARWYYKE